MSFLSTKKNPAPAGDDEGRISPAASESLIYFSMALVSGEDRENNHPLGGEVPGTKSMAQSYGRCGGSEVARALLNTSLTAR